MLSAFLLKISVTQLTTLPGDEPWKPPIGIPVPSFGINETYRMYDDPNARNESLTYYPSDSGGFYTHYVDMKDPNATDDGVPSGYGTKAHPCTRIPYNLPSGSIVEVHNEVRWSGPSGEVRIDGAGTASMPVFIRGVNMPRTERSLEVGYYGNAKYIIIEGMSFGNFRCDFYGTDFGASAIVAYENNDRDIQNIVIYNNLIHDHGDWDYEGSEDHDKGGIFIQNRASNIWVLENTVYHCEGTGIGIGPQPQNFHVDDPEIPHHIYIGRNLIYENYQTGLWSKTSRDAIFSQNVAWGHRANAGSSQGGGIGFQYDPKRLWLLFNRLYDNSLGVDTGDNYLGGSEEIYIIGNLIYNCTTEGRGGGTGGGDGMQINGRQDVNVLLNNIYNCPNNGIYNKYYPATLNIFNNIIARCPTVVDFLTAAQTTPDKSTFDYNLLDGTGNIKWNTTYISIGAFIAGTDQGDNCIEADPMFVNPANGDFRLQDASPVNSMEESPKVQVVIDRFRQLYGIDLREDIEGKERTLYDTADLNPQPEDTPSSDTSQNELEQSGSEETDTSASSEENTPQLQEIKTGSEADTSGNTEHKTTGIRNRSDTHRKIFQNFERIYENNNRSLFQKEHFE